MADDFLPIDFLPNAGPPERERERAQPEPVQEEPVSNIERVSRPSSRDFIPIDFLPSAQAQPQTQSPSRARGEKSLMGDIGTLFYSSMLDTLATGAAAGEYMTGSGGTLTAWRESLSQAAREAQKGVSQEMQAALSRRFIPSEDDAPSAYKSFGDFFGAVGAQAVASLGSIVASVPAIGVGVLGGGPVGGMVAGGATAGLLGMGTVWKDTAEAFQQIPEAERRRLNAGYASRRDAGMDPAQAIDETVREAAGRYPELAGILSAIPGAVMGRFEASLGARQMQGGVFRGARRGAVTEGLTELPEEVTQNIATQLGTERLTGEPFRVSEAAEAGVRGFIGGAGMGGALGAVGGAFQRGQPETFITPPPAPPSPTQQGVDPSIAAAAQNIAQTPAPAATTQETQDTAGVDAALSAALQQTAPPPVTQAPLAPLAQATTTATMSPTPDPLGAMGFIEEQQRAAPETPPQVPMGAVAQAQETQPVAGGQTAAVTEQDSAAIPPVAAAEGAASVVPLRTDAPPTARPAVEARADERRVQRRTALREAFGIEETETAENPLFDFADEVLRGEVKKGAFKTLMQSIANGDVQEGYEVIADALQNEADTYGIDLSDAVDDYQNTIEAAQAAYSGEAVQNLSKESVTEALTGDEGATRRTLQALARKVAVKPASLNESWTKTFMPALDEATKKAGFTKPEWFARLEVLIGATPGGNKEANKTRLDALKKLAADFKEQGAAITEAQKAKAKAVVEAFKDSSRGARLEPDSAALDRLKGIRDAIDALLMTAEATKAQREMTLAQKWRQVGGKKTDAGRILYVLSKVKDGTYGDVLNTIRIAEVLMRDGRYAEAERELKQAAAAAAEARGTVGTTQAEEGVEATQEEAAEAPTEDEQIGRQSEEGAGEQDSDYDVEQEAAFARRHEEGVNLLRAHIQATRQALPPPKTKQDLLATPDEIAAARQNSPAKRALLEKIQGTAALPPGVKVDFTGGKLTLSGLVRKLGLGLQRIATAAELDLDTQVAKLKNGRPAIFAANDGLLQTLFAVSEYNEGHQLLWNKWLSKVGDIPVIFVKNSVFDSIAKDDSTAGLFFPRSADNVRAGGPSGTIILPEAFLYDTDTAYNGVAPFTESFLHEIAHALTYQSAMTNTSLRKDLKKLLDIALKNFGKAIGGVTKNRTEAQQAYLDQFTTRERELMDYARRGGPDEFLALVFTSPDARSGFAKIALSESDRAALGIIGKAANVFKAFVEWTRKALGISADQTTVLEAAITLADDAFMSVEQQREALKDNPDARLVKHGVRALSLGGSVANVMPDGAKRVAINSGGKLRRLGLAFSTLRQMMFNSEGLFARTPALDALDPNDKRSPVAVVVQSYLQRAQMAVDLLNQIVMGPLRAMRALPKASREKVSEFLVDATMAEVHPDEPVAKGGKNGHVLDMPDAKKKKAEADHKKLSDQFNTFTPAEQAAYRAVVSSMEKAHARVIRSIVGSIVTRWYTNLVEKNLRDPQASPLPDAEIKAAGGPVPFIEGLIDRAYKKTLTQAESQMLGDEVFAMLNTAHSRSVMKGPYVPLQRFGDWVVRWNENEPETKVFDSEAERDAYTAGSSLNLKGERKIYLDANGKEITAADPAIEKAEIGKALSALPPTATPFEKLQAEMKAKRAALKATIKQNTAATKYEITQITKGVAFFESEAEAAEAVENLRKDGKQNVKEYDLRKNPKERASLLEDADFNKMKEAIEKDETVREAAKEKAIEALEQAMLMVVPNRALNASMVRRRKIIGADKNVTRAIANYGIAMANYASSIDTAIPITLGLKAMNDYTSAQAEIQPGAEATKTTARRREYIREIEERVLYNPLDTGGSGLAGPVIRKLQAMTYVYFLASPSYVMIQMTQPWLLTMPILSGQYGVARSVAAMTRANADIGLSRLARGGAKDTANALKALVTGSEADKEPLLDYVKANLAKAQDGQRLLQMIESLSKEGLLDGDAGMEIIRAEVSEDGPIGRFIGRTEVLARALPAMVEVVNRSSSAVAAYRLEYAKSGDHDAAVRKAYEVVDQSQGDYAAANTARFMDPRRYPLLSPMMTFRKYAQAVYALLIRQVLLATKGKDAETRRNAQKTLAMVLMAHASVAGMLGLPTEAFTLLLGITAFLFGSKEPWDWELMMRQEAAKLFGKEAAEVLMHGLPRYVGVDLSGRLGLNSLLFMHDLRDFEKKTANEYIGQLLTGAPGGMVLNAVDSWQQLNKAIGSDKTTDYTKAVEGMLPKGFRDPLRAWRMAEEGVTTRRGERIDEGRQLTAGETAAQALGFQPASVAEVYERRNAVQGLNRRLSSERSDLMMKWRQAEPASRAAIWQDIVEWNQKLEPGMRGFRVTRENLIQSLAESRRRAQTSGQGDYVPRGREGVRREGEFANTRSER